MEQQPDMIIVGAGLAGLITAWRCLDSNPELKVAVFTAEKRLQRQQVWSFNRDDIIPELADWAAPFIVKEWPSYDVRFLGKNRNVEIPYCYSDSARLKSCVQPFIDNGRLRIMFEAKVKDMKLQTVTLENGDTLNTHYVVDARGFENLSGIVYAYKHIMGRAIRTTIPHGVTKPVVIDAPADQVGGFQYIYCLPLSEDKILIEAICYSDGDTQDDSAAQARIDAYIETHKWNPVETTFEEKTILPLTLASGMSPDDIDIDHTLEATKVGIRCGYYHAVTGYSFAEILKSALVIDEYIQADGQKFAHGAAREMNQHEIDHFREERFLRLFNRRLFRGIKPSQRYKVFAHIYEQPEDRIARFYRGRMERADKLALIGLKSPVSIWQTLKYAKDESLLR